MVTTNQPTNQPTNRVNLVQVCSLNIEQSRLLQYTDVFEKIAADLPSYRVVFWSQPDIRRVEQNRFLGVVPWNKQILHAQNFDADMKSDGFKCDP